MKKLIAAAFACAALAVCAGEVPRVSGITMTQGSGSRLVTITYNLANAPAVVTLDIQTNVTGDVWASIGGENIQNVSGDVWKKVTTDGQHTITWRPDLSWPDHQIDNGGARAVVTAWSIDNPPDYLVVNIAANATTNSETYYPAVEFLPGGLLKNQDYRTSKIVMRKIPAKDVEWTMGSDSKEPGYSYREEMHTVTLADNYYIAVFETTQSQWRLIQTTTFKDQPLFTAESTLRPMENVSYNEIRNSTNQTVNANYDYPKNPNPKSYLGLLRAKTGLLFDLPSEAQWEFACRAGHGSGFWGDGSPIEAVSDTNTSNLARLGRFQYNGGKVLDSTGKYVSPGGSSSVTNGTAAVGSYAPNSWGLYDMHGNVWEWCLDWHEDNITTYNGAVNVDPSTPSKTISGATVSGRLRRGGAWSDNVSYCGAARRRNNNPNTRGDYLGFRLALPACPAGQSTGQ